MLSASGRTRVAVELVGLGVGEKLRNYQEDLSRLPAVWVSDACIDTVGPAGTSARGPPPNRSRSIEARRLRATRTARTFGAVCVVQRSAAIQPPCSSPPSSSCACGAVRHGC
jgi:hypothetical protein